MESVLLSRNEAEAQGKRFYFTGRPCQNGHHAPRYVSNGCCKMCLTRSSSRHTEVRLNDPRGNSCMPPSPMTFKRHFKLTPEKISFVWARVLTLLDDIADEYVPRFVPPQPPRKMRALPKANGVSPEEYVAVGWKRQQLVDEGYFAWEEQQPRTLRMLPAAQGVPYDKYRSWRWTDDNLIDAGYAEWTDSIVSSDNS